MGGSNTPRRRSFLRTVGCLGGGFAIAGCVDSTDDSSASTATSTRAGNEQLRTEIGLEYPDYELADELNVYQWTNYWHPNTVPDFEDAFGVAVSPSLYGSNEELYATLQNEGLDAYDVIFPSDWMVSKLIREEKLRAVDVSKLGNWENLGDRWIADAPYDGGDERYSVPSGRDTPRRERNVPHQVSNPTGGWRRLARRDGDSTRCSASERCSRVHRLHAESDCGRTECELHVLRDAERSR